MNDLLTKDELEAVTGAKQWSKMAEVLAACGINHAVLANGSIKTSWHDIHHPGSLQSSPPKDYIEWSTETASKFVYQKQHIIDNAKGFCINDFDNYHAVYFLLADTEILYIGLSTSLHSRLKQHVKDKKFNRIFVITDMPKYWLDAVEMFYINHFTPPLNDKYLPVEDIFKPLMVDND